MKKVALLVLAIVISSCANNHQISSGGHTQPIVSWDDPNLTEPCRDSLFLALQNKPYSQLTTYEHAYFQQKWDACNGTPEVSHGSTPEWILAIIGIIGIVVTIITLVPR